jgi:effector-binding domain-containing protein
MNNRKYFYVYYSYEPWGRGYIGKRECECLPEEDIKYFGSYRDKTFKPTEKIILEVFETAEKALKAEVALHIFYEVDKNPHFANKLKMVTEKFSYQGALEHKIYDPEFQKEFVIAVKESKTIMQILKKLGRKRGGGNYENVKKWINFLNLNDAHLIGASIHKGKMHTKETREKMSLYRKGKVKNEEHKRKIKLSNCKYVYTFISPEGIITETVWYTDFCKENNLNHCKIREVARGVRKHHKGWTATRRPRTNEDK